jgi:NADH dehydrogenase
MNRGKSMNTTPRIAVTGAFSYSGKYITHRLLDAGCEVITLTGRPERLNPFDAPVVAYPFNFMHPEALVDSLGSVDTLVNTYWVRFDYGSTSYLRAVTNTRQLFKAAKQAGVRRVVHISITNPDPYSTLPYFWGKAVLEEDLAASGLSYAILRPTLIFGKEDILLNNIAWFLRRFPLFAIPGDGEYRLQPIYVDDLAQLAVEQVFSDQDTVIEAIGPETITFNRLVAGIRTSLGSRAMLIHTPPMLAQRLLTVIGKLVGDVILTREEVIGLMEERLFVDTHPAGRTSQSEWISRHTETLGKQYANELNRHFQHQ